MRQYSNDKVPVFALCNVLIRVNKGEWKEEITHEPGKKGPGCTVPKHIHAAVEGSRLIVTGRFNEPRGDFFRKELINVNYFPIETKPQPSFVGGHYIVADVFVHLKPKGNRRLLDPLTGQVVIDEDTKEECLDMTDFYYIDVVEVDDPANAKNTAFVRITKEQKSDQDFEVVEGCWINVMPAVDFDYESGMFPVRCTKCGEMDMNKTPWDTNGETPFLCISCRPKGAFARAQEFAERNPHLAAPADDRPATVHTVGHAPATPKLGDAPRRPLRPWER
jgi:hypothetical protein